jgi:hypothetical protein
VRRLRPLVKCATPQTFCSYCCSPKKSAITRASTIVATVALGGLSALGVKSSSTMLRDAQMPAADALNGLPVLSGHAVSDASCRTDSSRDV